MVNKIFTGISVIIFLAALGLFVYGILLILGKVK
jgi:preprotein translocase subunit SecE